MAEEKGLVGRFLSTLTKPFSRRTTPEPMMPLWKTGIQEPVLVQGVSIPGKEVSQEMHKLWRRIST